MNAITGDDAIDEKNLLLAEIYTKILGILQGHAEKMLVGEHSVNGSAKKEVWRYRSACFLIRCEVKKLGGMPLGEPLTYWRFKFPIFAFQKCYISGSLEAPWTSHFEVFSGWLSCELFLDLNLCYFQDVETYQL